MNKTFIVVLAICLVSAHAKVKLDAPAENCEKKHYTIEEIKDQFMLLGKQLGEVIQEVTLEDLEGMKKNFNGILDCAYQLVRNIKQTEKKA